MLKRQTSGSVVCPSCGRLVGVREERCFNCGRLRPGLWGYAPLLGKLGRDLGFTQIILWGCSALFLASLLYAPDQIRMGGLTSLFSPSPEGLYLLGMSGAVPVFRDGRFWTVLSAAWLHGSLLHIFFNLMWARQLAPAIAELFGVGRLIIIYTVSSVVGFGLTSMAGLLVFLPGLAWPGPLQGAFYTVGASAPLFGLSGALYCYGQKTGRESLREYGLQFLVIWLVIGVVASSSGPGGVRIDNWAHLGGFIGGYLAARALDPLAEEKPQHLILGLLCLGLTALSLILSVLHGWQLMR